MIDRANRPSPMTRFIGEGRSAYSIAMQISRHAQALHYGSNILVHTNRLMIDLRRANGLPLIDTGIDRVGILGGKPPEGVFDDPRRVVAHAQFQV